jgi:hypothetical protein
MILVVEGINGSGKTTLCKSLSKYTSWPILRAFRRPGRNFQEQVAKLQSIGVPVNTYVEDMFMAEALGTTKANVILDRSLPSGIAYGVLNGDFQEDDPRLKHWVELWQESLLVGGGKVGYIYLGCTRKESKERCLHGKFPLAGKEEWWTVATQLDRVWNWVEIPKLSIDTSGYGETVTLEIAKRFVDEHKRANQANASKGKRPRKRCACCGR